MGSTVLRAQLNELMHSMYTTGLLGEQFQQLQMVQDADSPGFVAEVLTLFFNNTERILSELAELLKQEPVDFSKVHGHVHQLKGSSSSVGGRRVVLVCVNFLEFIKHNNMERCIVALNATKHEYYDLRNKFQAMIQLEQQIQALEQKK